MKYKTYKMDERHLSAHNDLRQFREYHKRLEALRLKIQQQKTDKKILPPEYSNKIQQRETAYLKLYDETEDKICEIEKIFKLMSPESGNILRDYYLKSKTLEEIAYKMPCAFRTIYRLKVKALLEYYIKKNSL